MTGSKVCTTEREREREMKWYVSLNVNERTCILLMTFHPSSTPKMGMYLDSLGNNSWSNTSNVPFSYRMACRVIVVEREHEVVFLLNVGRRFFIIYLRDSSPRLVVAGYTTSPNTFDAYINGEQLPSLLLTPLTGRYATTAGSRIL